MMFAQGLFDFGVSETVLHIVRIIAAVGGAVVGWFACDPLTRLIYRLSFKGTTPASLLFFTKATGAATLSLLIYFFMPLGGGGAGFGWGPGQGGGPGKGAGSGGDKNASVATTKDGKSTPSEKIDNTKSPTTLERVDIVIVSRAAFKEDGNDFYLLKGAEPPLSLNKLEAYFKTHHATIEVTPVLTADSIAESPSGNPLGDLLALTKKYDIKTLQTKRP